MAIELSVVDLKQFYTADQFEALPSDGSRYELIEGQLIQMPPTGDEHGTVIDNLYRQFVLMDPSRKLGKVWITTSFKFDAQNVLEPDLAFVVASRVPKVSKKALEVIPDLVVEVWSPSDLRSKRQQDVAQNKIKLYQQFGVRLIWAINPSNRTVEVYRDVTTNPIILKVDDLLSGFDIIPGFQLPVQALFE